MNEYTPIHDARDEVRHVLRTASELDPISREHLAKVEYILTSYTRAGNLSPEYLLAVDKFNRESAAHNFAERAS